MIQISNKLSNLLDEVFQCLYVENLGLNHAEPIFLKILEQFKHSEEDKKWFLEHAKQSIINCCDIITTEATRPENFIDSDLICFIAHATKWGEFAGAAGIRKKSKAYSEVLPGDRDIADDVESALRDDWEDRDFYKVFTNGK
ncbi:MAG: hypothetical protein HY080_01195 [Gammaproteobacteria bacterium]|nr:hypothetical protein [Gammaproteobacteria bacterium]